MPTDRARQLGEASIPRLLIRFSVPAIVGMVAQAMYNIADRIFIGRGLGAEGPDGIAGATVALPYMLVLLAFAMLVGFGAGSLVSIRLGERNKEAAERVLGNAIVLMLALSAILTVAGLLLLDPLLRIFGASERVLPYARPFLRIIVIGTVFQVVGFGLNAVIRGEGSPRVAMVTLLLGVLLNLILAPLFIFVFGWGMAGAALGTVLSQAVAAIWTLAHFLGPRSLLKLHARHLTLDRAIAREILIIGSPPCLMQIAASVMNSLLNNQLHVYGGDVAISVMGILYAIVMMIAMPIFGLNQGAQPIIGYNYGAQKFDRVKRTLLLAVLGATGFTLVGFAAVMLFPAAVIRLFSRQDEALVQLGVHAIRMSMIMQPLIGFQVICATYFQAVGKPRQAMLLMLSRQVLLLIPAVLILPRFFGLDGVWLAIPVADFFSSMLTGMWFFLEWRHLTRSHEVQTASIEATSEMPWEG